jgi:hypothetical protein
VSDAVGGGGEGAAAALATGVGEVGTPHGAPADTCEGGAATHIVGGAVAPAGTPGTAAACWGTKPEGGGTNPCGHAGGGGVATGLAALHPVGGWVHGDAGAAVVAGAAPHTCGGGGDIVAAGGVIGVPDRARASLGKR